MRRAIVPAALAAALTAFTTGAGTDYQFDAEPAINALARGDLHGFAAAQAQMGPLSLLLRAPTAALVGPGSVWAYRLGALVCLLAAIGLGALISRRAGAGAAVIAATLLVVNPIALDALHLGHPEELLGGSLCVLAVLLARDRKLLAVAALAGALATKQWALIAIAPVLLAGRREDRVPVAAMAFAAAAAIIAPFALADPHAFIAALHNPAFGIAEMRTGNVWGAVAISHHVPLGGGESTVAYVTPRWLQHLAHPLVAAITLGLGTAALRRRGPVDPLALLAVLMLIRCALDPWNHAYYHAPFLAALIAWEVLEARRPPIVAAVAAAFLGVVFRLDLPLSDVLYAAWVLPTIWWLSRRALRLAPLRLAPRLLPAA